MRPIDADALRGELMDAVNAPFLKEMRPTNWAEAYESCVRALDRYPTLDYAPVIRCKDCMWWKTNGCWFHQPGKCVEREPNDFCSDGQRRRTDVRITD